MQKILFTAELVTIISTFTFCVCLTSCKTGHMHVITSWSANYVCILNFLIIFFKFDTKLPEKQNSLYSKIDTTIL
jgi:hypothetical protein